MPWTEEAMRGGRDEDEFESTIMTERLTLMVPDARHHQAITTLAANPRVAENLAALPAAQSGETGGSFVVIERASAAPIGHAAFGPMVDRRASVEIAVWIGEPFWGRGYATEATQAVIDRAFADERITVLWCSNRASNTRARRVIEKCGFQFRETGMVRSPARGGAMPVERFVLERRNWRSLKAWGAFGEKRESGDAPRHNAA
jgi:RimJ/RimL family protein N-acetyltransferase